MGKEPIEGVENILGKLAQREAKEECGLDVSADNTVVLKNKVFVRPDNVPVFMVTLATSYEGGEIELEKAAFTDFAWVSAEQALDYDCINGIQGEIAQAIKSL